MLLEDDRPVDIRPLRAHCTGDVVVPGERVWEEVLAEWDLRKGQEPAAVVFPANDFDVAAAISYVRYAGLEAALPGRELPGDLRGTVLVQDPRARRPWSSGR